MLYFLSPFSLRGMSFALWDLKVHRLFQVRICAPTLILYFSALGSGLMHMPMFLSDDSSNSGCRFNGTLTVNRHAGTLHVIMGKQINLGIGGNFHAHIQFGGAQPLNFSHRIDHLSFGSVKVPYFGSLDNELKITNEAAQEYQYTITVVPVSIDSSKAKVHTYQLRLF